MRSDLALGAAVLTLAAASAATAADRVEIKDAVARVTVIPENRRDVKVEFITTNQALPLEIKDRGDKLIVDGNLRRRIKGCHGAHWTYDINGKQGEGRAAVAVNVRDV